MPSYWASLNKTKESFGSKSSDQCQIITTFVILSPYNFNIFFFCFICSTINFAESFISCVFFVVILSFQNMDISWKIELLFSKWKNPCVPNSNEKTNHPAENNFVFFCLFLWLFSIETVNFKFALNMSYIIHVHI